MRSSAVAVVLLVAGIVLFIWGLQAKDSLSSQTSELFQGAPSDKAMILMVTGGVMAGAGLLSLARRPSA